MFKVTKEIHFCYGHRLLNYEGKCRFLHGHNAKVQIDLSSEALDHRGMVIDFNDVKQTVQGWIDSALDHKMLLNKADPLIPHLNPLKEPIVTLEINPTAEALARMIFDYAKAQGFPVTEVRFWETPTSFATYHA
ncbi:MAG: 6-carboxytetrahydropterin synthase QueD [Candidatus Omnitrophica bacterium]|nr:6-carboxytetrahydropterin synthase QueD [Candidatus Omnitrophota bacterium]